MGYTIKFKVKVQDADIYMPIGTQFAQTTYNLGGMIRSATGLEWNNGKPNGLVKDAIPHIEQGLGEVTGRPDLYKRYEAPNGWGTLYGCASFFRRILEDWDAFKKENPEFVDYVYFCID